MYQVVLMTASAKLKVKKHRGIAYESSDSAVARVTLNVSTNAGAIYTHIHRVVPL